MKYKKIWICLGCFLFIAIVLAIALPIALLHSDKTQYNLTFESQTVIYDGNRHYLEVTGDIQEDYEISYVNNEGHRDVGIYEIAASVRKKGTLVVELKATLTILKAEIKNITFEDVTIPYDGTVHSIFVSGNLPEGVTVEYENNEQENAGIYQVIAHFKESSNYEPLGDLVATLHIEQIDLNLASIDFMDKEVTYDGILKELKVDGDLPKGIVAKYENNAHVDAGIYEATVVFEDTLGNYKKLGSKTATLTIQKADYDMSNVTFQSLEVTYDGNPHSILIEGTLPSGVKILNYKDNEKIYAGTYLASVEFIGDEKNYNPIPSLKATLTIKKATYDISSISFSDRIFIYDGLMHSLEIEGTLPTGVEVVYSLNSLKEVGQIIVTASFKILDEDNYEKIPSKQATLTIVPKSLNVALEDQTFSYTGKPHYLKLEGELPAGVIATWQNNGQIEVGIYEVSVSFNIASYPTLKATLCIIKADIDLSNVYFYGQTFVYDGNPHTLFITGDLPDYVQVHYLNNTRIEPGRQTATAVFVVLDKEHYNEIPSLSAELIIIENQIPGISFQDKSFVYDQKAHNIYIEGDLPEGVLVSYIGNEKKNVGVYEVTATFTDTTGLYGNLNDMVAKMTILKASFAQNGILFLDREFTYDGSVHSLAIYCDDLPSDIIVKYENNDQIDAGIYRVRVSFLDLEGNYYPVEDVYATLTIHRKKINMDHIRFENEEYEYDGNPHTLLIHGQLPKEVRVEYSDNTLTKLGRIEVTATFIVDTKNYEPIASMKATLTITKGSLPDIYLVDKTVTYDGNTHSIEYVGGLPSGVSIHFINNDKTEAGTYKVTAELWDSEGYYNSLTATLTILTAVYDIHFDFFDQTITYDGLEHTLVITGDLPEGVVVSYTNNTMTSAGVLVVTASFIGNPNYEPIPLMTATLTILKKEITNIRFDGATYTYDGKPHRLEVQGIDEYPVEVLYYNNDKTSAGEYDVVASFVLKDENYLIVPNMTAKLIISPIPLEEIKIEEQTFVLDGTTHYFNIDFELPEGIRAYCLNDGQIYEGIYEITILFESMNSNYILPEPIQTKMIIYSDGSFHTVKFHLSETQTEIRIVEHAKSLEDLPKPLPKDGYEGYYEETFDEVLSAMDVYPKYRKALFTISFDVEGVDEISVYYMEPYTLPIPILEEYAFKKWADSNGNIIEDGNYIWTEDIFLYAVFQCKVVIKNPNDYIYEEIYLDSNELIEPKFPYSSYFKGFYLDKQYNVPFDTSKPVKQNLELFAKYEYDFSYVIEDDQVKVIEILDKTKTSYKFTDMVYDLYPIVEIPDAIFSGCSQVEEIGLPVLNSDFGSLFGTKAYENSVLIEQRQGSFYLPSTLKTVRLKMDVVPTFAFYNCQMIETLYLDNINLIEGYAFNQCVGLKEIYIQSCEAFDESIFNGCENLDCIYVDSLSSWMNLSFYNLFANPMYYAKEIRFDGVALTELDLKDFTQISDYQFYGMHQITKVDASNITKIGVEAFGQCSKLNMILLSSSLEESCVDAFMGCTQLKVVYYDGTIENWGTILFENQFATPMAYDANCYTRIDGEFGIADTLDLTQLSSLRDYQYYGFSGIKEIHAESLEKIGSMALSHMGEVESLYISKNLQTVFNEAFIDTTILNVNYLDELEDWLNISFHDLYSTPLWSRKGNIILGNSALSLEDIIFDETITSIDAFQFFGFKDVKSIVCRGELASIGKSAFGGCSLLESFSFSSIDNLEIEENAFLDCVGLKDVYYSKSIEDYSRIQFANALANPLYYNANLWLNGNLVEELTITSNPKQYQYYGLSSLRKVTFGETVKQIGAFAFANCMNLEELIHIEQIEVLGASAFDGNQGLKELRLESVSYIPSSCFRNCKSLATVTLPNVTRIGDNAFLGCSSLVNISLEAVEEIGNSSFKGANSLRKAELIHTNKIGSEAFSNCYNLEEVILSEKLESIGFAAFYGCSKLTQIILPQSIKRIDGNAFAGASNLTIFACYSAKPSSWSSSFSHGVIAVYWYQEEYLEGNYWHYDENNEPKIW